MERIDLQDVDDAIAREKLFVKAATKLLGTLEFKRVEDEYSGELMKSKKEIESCEGSRQKDVDRRTMRHHERRLEKKSRSVELDSDDLGSEDFAAPVLSNSETRRKNKRKHGGKESRSEKRRRMKSRQKRHRR